MIGIRSRSVMLSFFVDNTAKEWKYTRLYDGSVRGVYETGFFCVY